MMLRLTSILGVIALTILSGCHIGSVRGQEGNIRFRTDDSMFGQYAYAVGSTILVGVDLLSPTQEQVDARSEFLVQSDDPAVFEVEWATPGSSMLLRAVGAGSAHIEVLGPDGDMIDRFGISAAEADRLSVCWPKPLSDMFGNPTECIASDLTEMRILEGGSAPLHLAVYDAGSRRLAGQMRAVVTIDDTEILRVGTKLDSDGGLVPEQPFTNGAMVFLPLAGGEAEVHIEQASIAADIRIHVGVVPVEAPTEIAWGMDVTREAEEPGHAANTLLWYFLRDANGEVVHGGRFQFFNETPDLVSIISIGCETAQGCSFLLVNAREEVGLARIRVEEAITELSAVLELPVGPKPQEEESVEE